MSDELDREVMKRLMTTVPKPTIFCFDQIDSTNTFACTHQLPDWSLVVANQQLAGKGRRGHHFLSPAQTGIYMTMVLPVQEDHLKNPGVLTASFAVGVRRAIKRLSGLQLGIKWLNDLYLPAGKCGGILVETVNDDQNKSHQFVVGIGLNVRGKSPSQTLDQPITGMALPLSLSRNQLIAAIYSECVQIYCHFDAGQLLNAYRHHCLWLHQQVSAQVNDRQVVGTLVGVDDRARLLLCRDDGLVEALDATVAHTIRRVH